MDREDECHDRRGGGDELRAVDVGAGEAEQTLCEQIHEHRVQRVEQHVREVIAGGPHAPQRVVQPERHPGQRHVVPEVKRAPHPAQLRQAESAVMRILYKVFLIVPADEPIPDRRRKGDQRRHRDGDRRPTRDQVVRWPVTGRGRSAAHITRQEDGSR